MPAIEPIEWATVEDARLVDRDMSLYGTAFIERDGNGLHRRVDPATIQPTDLPPGTLPQLDA